MNIDQKLITNLADISHVMQKLYEGKGSQKRILIILNGHNGTMSQKELTAILKIRPASVCEVLDKLLDNQLIIKKADPNDNRVQIVTLTEAGKEKAIQASKEREIRHEEMFKCLNNQEKEELIKLLEKINNDWERYRNVEIH
ncbi:MAG: MarR family winged helix-turn-helix transcriptional regulator [Erysipelotrichaceae bacterium]